MPGSALVLPLGHTGDDSGDAVEGGSQLLDGFLGSTHWHLHFPSFMTATPCAFPPQIRRIPETDAVGHVGVSQTLPLHPSTHLHEQLEDPQLLVELPLVALQMHDPRSEQGFSFSSVGQIGVLQSVPPQPVLQRQLHLPSAMTGTPLQLHCWPDVDGQLLMSQDCPTHPGLHTQLQPLVLYL